MFKTPKGYNVVWINGRGTVYEAVLIAEKILGKPLPNGAHVHHVNGIKDDNRHSNLVICQDQKYHGLLHRRTDAYKATGNSHCQKCWICKQWDEPAKLYLRTNGISRGVRPVHRNCQYIYHKNWKKVHSQQGVLR